MSDTASTSASPDILWLTQGDASHSVSRANSRGDAPFELRRSLLVMLLI